MPCALFCQDAKISKAYSTGADAWKHAARNGLPDNDCTVHPCEPDPKEKHDPGATDIELPVSS